MMVSNFLILSTFLFVLALLGVAITKKSFINTLMSIELMLLACNINFIAASKFQGNADSFVIAMIVLAVAAVEMVIGLAIITIYYKNKGNIMVDGANSVKE
jgi:NADH-quinone oxidoreductase subunit K